MMMLYTPFLALLLPALVFAGCRPGWQGPLEGACFKRASGTHVSAAEYCKTQGGYLYRPDTIEKVRTSYKLVLMNFNGCGNGHYTPVDALFINGKFRWGITGHPLNPQPAHHTGKDCLVQRQRCTGPVFDAVPCGTAGAVFCAEQISCPTGWQGPEGGECFKFNGGNRAQGVERCHERGAYLYRPDTPQRIRTLYNMVKRNFNGCGSGHYTPVDAQFIHGKWRWGVTGEELTPQPPHPNGRDCLIQRQPCSGPHFEPVHCSVSGAVMCAQPLKPKRCPRGWQGPYGGECFKKHGGNRLQGVNYCRDQKATLYRPDTPEKVDILYSIVKDNFNGCGHGHYTPVDAHYTGGKWIWSGTGQELTPQPAHVNGRDCLIQRQRCPGPIFEGVHCSVAGAFFCSKPLYPKVCPQGWKGPIDNRCFKHGAGLHSEAVTRCRQQGAMLYRPDTPEKEQIMYTLIKEHYNSCGVCHYAHVDAKYVNGKWVWTSSGIQLSPQPPHGQGRECLIQRQACSGPYFDSTECHLTRAAYFCAK